LARTFEFRSDAMIVRFTGMTKFAALRGTLRIPYGAIRSMSTKPFAMPSGTIRVGGTAIPFTDYRQGSYWKRGIGWLFVSYEHADQTVTLAVNNVQSGRFDYSLIVLGVESPEMVAAAIAAHGTPGDAP
jgi:hypothetical protein